MSAWSQLFNLSPSLFLSLLSHLSSAISFIKGVAVSVSCGVVSESVIKWTEYPLSLLVKLLFLLDKGDLTAQGRSNKAKAAAQAFHAILMNGICSSDQVLNELQKRLKVLVNYGFFELRAGTEAAKYHVIQQDKDLLSFTDTCHYLGIHTNNALEGKIRKVRRKLRLTPVETTWNFFIHSENLWIMKMCDLLTPRQIHKFLAIIQEKGLLQRSSDQYLTVFENMMQIDGMKECLFFYMIRCLEFKGTYTKTVMDVLEKLGQEAKTCQERDIITDLTKDLRCYPSKCHPTGYCIVFCVTVDRDGAESEIEKVQRVFDKSLGFVVEIQRDPVKETINTVLENLKSPKYDFYDSLIVWFIGRGGDEFKLADGTYYSKKKIPSDFCGLKTFSKKPKLFFMVSDQEEALPAISHDVDTGDGREIGITRNSFPDITAPQEMDYLISSVTLPSECSSINKCKGSPYVHSVCKHLEKHCGQDIMKAFQEIHKEMNFSNGFMRARPYYSFALQKMFIIPKAYKQM
ncbi:uncharacterized protein LOC125040704 isoform X2 [Penaeus chinensis]|uniref:uncharacterized protein LOC125040704 isoform X2 n=1 Tax=Penaeus chinensis TaxID=139456 RepID=UPI001FB59C32|nr:uncharacterized protein LOC125040704 isoform X2 [Penaeus chinensis]XP_047491357.1 uncharacterized protein LOC125040704 isoform X2 [Penaeus chinensis]